MNGLTLRSVLGMWIPVLLLAGLGAGTSPTPSPAPGNEISVWGTMREVLKDGQSGGRVLLDSVLTANTVGVGALADLEGEVTILDGRAYIAIGSALNEAMAGHADSASLDLQTFAESVGRTGLRESTTGDSAALLVMAEVAGWDEVPLGDCPSYAALETRIAAQLRKRGADLGRPQPVRVRGRAVDLGFHVIAGACPVANPDGPPPWRFSGATGSVELVGFYVEDAAGRLTHHDRVSHLHVLASGVTGHLEDISLEDATLLLPKVPAENRTKDDFEG